MNRLNYKDIAMPSTYRFWFALNNNQLLNTVMYAAGKIDEEDAKGFRYTKIDEESNKPTITFNWNNYTKLWWANANQQEVEASNKPFIFFPNEDLPNNIIDYVFYIQSGDSHNNLRIELWHNDDDGKDYYCCSPLENSFTIKVLARRSDNTLWDADVMTKADNSYYFLVGGQDHEGLRGYIYGEAQLTLQTSVSVGASSKIYNNRTNAENYLLYGIDEGGLYEEGSEEPEEPAEDRITTLFYASNIYSRAYNDSNLQRLGASTIYIDIQYAKNDGTLLVDKNRAICGYVNTNNAINDENHFGNIIWMAANNVKILETKQSWLNGGFSDTQTLPQFATTTGFYGPLIDGSTIYESRYNTNMRIFANRQDAEEFLRGGNPTPIAGGTNAGQFNPDKLVGDPTVYNNPSADISADMSSCWILTKSEVDELANILATGLTSQESEENGILVNTLLTTGRSFSAHAEPIDAIVDLFWLPFNPREFSNNDYDHLVFAEDKYCSFEALGEAVDAAGQAVKGAYSNPLGKAFLPGGVFVQAYESGKEVGEKIASVIDVGETLNKFNIVSNMRDNMN